MHEKHSVIGCQGRAKHQPAQHVGGIEHGFRPDDLAARQGDILRVDVLHGGGFGPAATAQQERGK